jgi:hypothetical protein
VFDDDLHKSILAHGFPGHIADRKVSRHHISKFPYATKGRTINVYTRSDVYRLHELTSLRRRHVEHAWPRGPCAAPVGRAEPLLGLMSTVASIVESLRIDGGPFEKGIKARTRHSKASDTKQGKRSTIGLQVGKDASRHSRDPARRFKSVT